MRIMALVMGLLAVVGNAGRVQAGDELTGIAKLACEARLCLSTASPPAECSAALAYYYSLRKSRRQAFLDKCPMAGRAEADNPDAVTKTVVDADGVEVSLGVIDNDDETLLSVCGACGDKVGESDDETP